MADCGGLFLRYSEAVFCCEHLWLYDDSCRAVYRTSGRVREVPVAVSGDGAECAGQRTIRMQERHAAAGNRPQRLQLQRRTGVDGDIAGGVQAIGGHTCHLHLK